MIIDIPPERHPECLAVLHEGFGTVVGEFGLTAVNTPSNPAFWEAGDVEWVVARGSQLFALESGSRIVGCAFVGPSGTHPDGRVLRHLTVLPSERHLGHGEALVREAARRATDAGASVLRIGIIADNTRLSEWYQRLGFVTVESRRRYPGLVFAVDHLESSLPIAGPS